MDDEQREFGDYGKVAGNNCKHCDKVVYPEVPETIGNRHFGVRFLLYIAYLRYEMNLP
ncbi:hypothetical protein C5S32_07755 [ANME-1 cluster archaeon GoMg1]|nr:hypothetical protein [ANME-1 cluster archaeon GoMg1]